ncbi:uncharacterized protein LOC142240294 [Haematobia irritans]|uniref:uncharacterized protein LOC142240294 n=1 Tax=Haematobia irritans TaxID=7368 RepID=UPI003F507656
MGDHTPQPPPPPDNKSNNADDKQSEAGAGSTTNQEFRQNHPQPQQVRPPMPHELTAEWTVRAQLRFARAGETVRKDFSTNDPINPVRVVYKWSTLDEDGNAMDEGQNDKHSDVFKRNSSRSSGYSHDPGKEKSRNGCRKEESFRSTASSTTCYGGADSAFSGSNTSNRKRKSDPNKTQEDGEDDTATSTPYYGTRCRSTCNIIVSAVADFLPPPGHNIDEVDDNEVARHMSRSLIREEEPDPFVFNTTACYTVVPEKSFEEDPYSQTPRSQTYSMPGKILNLRDAICQTSDTETRYFEEYEHRRYKQSLSPMDRRDSRRAYDQRRATTEALLHPHGSGVNEGNTFRPSYMPSSPTPAFKSASMPRIPSIEGEDVSMGGPSSHALGSLPAFMASNKTVQSATDGQKKPRTVHIDVYCTGSEDEDHADAESSSESEDNRRHDQESNSTFQTVLDNEQMRLRHQRMTGGAMPRRLGGGATVGGQQKQSPGAQHQQQQTSSESQTFLGSDLQLGQGITKSSTADEVNESKQLLFRKHIGDQRAIKLANLRQKYLRQSSDDALSMGYPSSTRSTVRDNTCSSVSSVLAGHDVVDAASTWKETDDNEDYSLTKSDSFEYENAMDRLRIRQMERLWSRSHSKEEEPNQGQGQHHHQPHNQPGAMHHLQTISEVNTPHRISSFGAGGARLQRDDTLPSESEFYSETDQSYGAPAQEPMRSNMSPIITTSPTQGFHQTQHFSRNRPGFLHFFGPQNQPNPTEQPLSAPVEGSLLYPNYQAGLQRWKSETRENLSASPGPTPTERSRHSTPQPAVSPVFLRGGSEAPPATTSATTFPTTTPTPVRRLDMFQSTYRQSPAASDASSALPPAGYSSEYLDKASKFGKVVPARKPGHHVGPTKNPNCSCESCQRWMAERFQVRGRAFSLGESTMLKRVKK